MEGVCGICGETKKLTYEHIPPETAFNNGRAQVETYEQSIRRRHNERSYGKYVQGGVGDYTLCGDCNSKTGAWYVNEYTSWAYQAASLLSRSDGDPRLAYIYHGFPGRFFKQIVTMFMSVERPALTERWPDLKHYLLSRFSKEYDPALRIYAYYNPSHLARQSGGIRMYKSETGAAHAFAEMAFFPFGFVLVEGGPRPDSRLTDITHLAEYGYFDFRHVPLQLCSLPVAQIQGGIYNSVREYREGPFDLGTISS